MPPYPPSPFPGAHVLITGAGSGIGAALAAGAAGAGAAAVSVLDCDPAAAARTVAALMAGAAPPPPPPGRPFRAAAFTADVTDEGQVKAAVAAAVAAHGPVGVLVANAGIGPASLFLDASPAHFARVFSVNFQGVVHTLAAALPSMAGDASAAGGRHRRAVVVMGSTAGFAGAAGLSAYCASKAALRSLAACLRLEVLGLAPHLSIHLAAPGFADTPLVSGGAAASSPAGRALHAALVPLALPSPARIAAQVVAGVEAGTFLIPAGGPGATALAALARDPGGPGVAWFGGGGGSACARAAAFLADAAAALPLVAAAACFRGMLERKTGAALGSVGLGRGVAPVTAAGGGGVKAPSAGGGGFNAASVVASTVAGA